MPRNLGLIHSCVILPTAGSFANSPLVTQTVKNLLAMWETWVQFLGWEDPLEEGMATHSSNLALRIPMDREAWQVIVLGSQRFGHG